MDCPRDCPKTRPGEIVASGPQIATWVRSVVNPTAGEKMKVQDAIVRVYISRECWDSGMLRPFFEDVLPKDEVPIYFRVTNCDWDPEANCYAFKIPFLVGGGEADVYIPANMFAGFRSDGKEKYRRKKCNRSVFSQGQKRWGSEKAREMIRGRCCGRAHKRGESDSWVRCGDPQNDGRKDGPG
jgi:hypothetical protein